jgi:hypothetical protein
MSEGGQPMSRLSLQQIRGVADLIHDAVTHGVDVIEETHQAIARKPFALLKQIDPIAAPVRTLEHIERNIAGGVYQSIRLTNRLAATLSTQVLDWLEETERRKAKGERRKAKG